MRLAKWNLKWYIRPAMLIGILELMIRPRIPNSSKAIHESPELGACILVEVERLAGPQSHSLCRRIPYAAVFRGCGFVTVLAQLAIIGVTHELGDGDFSKAKTPTAPYEGLKDVWSFLVGGLFYYVLRLVF